MSARPPRRRVGVLVSGRGSNLAALLAAAGAPDYPAEIALVLSNRPGAKALERAAEAGVPTEILDHKAFATREAFDAALDARLGAAGIEIVCLAGFMRLLTADFTVRWEGRMLNVHPALLPAFKGLDTHARALEAGVRIHGCTVHFVTADMDAGPILAQAAVPVLAGDTEESLAARVLEQEHAVYPRALAELAAGSARLEGGRVRREAAAAAPPPPLVWS